MRLRVRAALALATSIVAPLVLAEDWPRWRGPSFDGTSSERGVFARPFHLEIAWKVRLGSGYSAIAVADGLAVTMFSDGDRDHVVALDAASGVEKWRAALAATYPGRDGANDGPVSTPAIEDGKVYALGPRGDLVALDLASGRPLWRRQLVDDLGAPRPHWGFASSPLVAGKLLIVLTGGGPESALTAFEKSTGEVVWRAGTDDVSYQSPMLATWNGEPRLIVGGDRFLFAFDASTGKELWAHEHGGEGFYARILNPVPVGDALLLTFQPDRAKLVRPGTDQEVWTTPHLKHNYAPPLFHDGFIYGYSGSFLSCIEAESGELVWRSRPPGNGFAILVDGHLVVQTKRGSLHVVEATPAGYRERAALDLFDLQAWTPPSFARGRIYARDSFQTIAAVDVVPGTSAGRQRTIGGRPGQVPHSEFARWVAEVERAPDAVDRVRRFVAEQKTFPIVEGERIAHVIYAGEVQDIALRTDLLESGEELPLRRVGETNLYYASFELEPDARVHYQFVRNLSEFIADPRGAARTDSLVNPGTVSSLFMPASDRGPLVDAERGTAHGRLVEVPFSSVPVRVDGKTWGGEREVRVYLPPGYDESDRRYPTLYVLYGRQMLETAKLDSVLDRLIGREIEPLVAVFVASISPYEYARSQREVHGQMLVEQLVPLIDGRFRTRREASQRAVLAVDEGAYAALEIGFRYPTAFERIAALSVLPIGGGDEELLTLIENAGTLPLRIYLDWGRYDQRRSAQRVDVPAYSRRLRERLLSRGYTVAGREWNDGSDLDVWGIRSTEALRLLFPRAR